MIHTPWETICNVLDAKQDEIRVGNEEEDYYFRDKPFKSFTYCNYGDVYVCIVYNKFQENDIMHKYHMSSNDFVIMINVICKCIDITHMNLYFKDHTCFAVICVDQWLRVMADDETIDRFSVQYEHIIKYILRGVRDHCFQLIKWKEYNLLLHVNLKPIDLVKN